MAVKADPISRMYGDRLRSVRQERQLRQVDVATRLGMSAGGYSSIERGMARMFVPDLERYALALGVDPGYLGRRLGLCGDLSHQEIRVTECADILAQLDGEPPEIVESVMLMLRTSVEIAKGRRLARDN